MTDFTLPLDTHDNALETVGGKGRSLSRLANAGFSVPGGFQVPTSAYCRFVTEHGIHDEIIGLAKPEIVTGAVSFEAASMRIRAVFDEHDLPAAIADAIVAAYSSLGGEPAVAVRSSANAEDLPELSFAGQQETYLNVKGADAVLTAVRNCWASLWTAQAINYRHEMDIPQNQVAMAVVVQVMVPSEVSGILFTANPATGERNEMIINASFGLGEAVVSGQVTPDTYIVDRGTQTLTESLIGTKERMIVAGGGQGTRTLDVAGRDRAASALSDAAITELASLALAVEKIFDGVPQDIEWAVTEGAIHLLQSRPITNLPPQPPRDVGWPEIAGAQLLKRQVAENMPDPLSPLFEDLYLRAIYDTQTWPEGWVYKGSLTPNYMKNFVVATVNGYAYQAIWNLGGADWKKFTRKLEAEQAALPWYSNLKRAIAMPHYFIERMKGGPLHGIYLMMSFFRLFRKYPAIVKWEKQQLPDYLAAIEPCRQRDPATVGDRELLEGITALTLAEADYWHALRSVIGTAKMTDGGFQQFLQENAPDEGLISGSFLSGFPSRTLDAEVAMRAIADDIRRHGPLYELIITTPTPRFLESLADHPEGRPVSEAIQTYLDSFGRQVFNLDFAEPSLAEEPLPFVMSLKALVRDAGSDPADRRREVARNRRARMRAALEFFKGRQRWEFLQRYLTARINYPSREESLFFMGFAWSVLRPWALELGGRLTETGSLGRADDVFYLTSEELKQAIGARASGAGIAALKMKAREQRALRELRSRMNQPAAIPEIASKADNPYATLKNNDDGTNVLRGFAVSPGTVTGVASVIMSPNEFDRMQPGSILVCPLTTPAWTQLFPHAAGLVTDIGSILAHGSIVAREYGIPAVLGIGDVTQRVKSGQTIAVDGDRGTVTILDP